MECEVDTDMAIMGTTQAKWYGAPGPFFCGPKSQIPQTGVWDYAFDCNNPWADPPLSCDVYKGQRAGRYDNAKPMPNRNGRTDVEGCCWWGRGVIQTTGERGGSCGMREVLSLRCNLTVVLIAACTRHL